MGLTQLPQIWPLADTAHYCQRFQSLTYRSLLSYEQIPPHTHLCCEKMLLCLLQIQQLLLVMHQSFLQLATIQLGRRSVAGRQPVRLQTGLTLHEVPPTGTCMQHVAYYYQHSSRTDFMCNCNQNSV